MAVSQASENRAVFRAETEREIVAGMAGSSSTEDGNRLVGDQGHAGGRGGDVGGRSEIKFKIEGI